MNKLIVIIIFMLLVLSAFGTIRFLLGEDEDTWICQNGEWLRHGNPSGPKPDNATCFKKVQENVVTNTQGEQIAKIYYSNTLRDPQLMDCSVVYEVERNISPTKGVARAALDELVKGQHTLSGF